MTPRGTHSTKLTGNFDPLLRKLFADDPNHTQTFTFDAAKPACRPVEEPRVPHAVGHLLTEQTGVLELRDLFAGEHISFPPRTRAVCTPRRAASRPTP